MTTPETIMTDNGKGFLSQTFAELLEEMRQRGSRNLSLTRGDGEALALMTTDPAMIEIIEGLIATAEDLGEGADHV